MAEIPTMNFRFVKRRMTRGCMGDWPQRRPYTAHILQQMFWVGSGTEWRDVPVIEEVPQENENE